MLISKRESLGLKHTDDSKIVIEYLDYTGDVYEILMHATKIKRPKMLIISDYMIADIAYRDKKHNPIVTELFIKSNRINISPVFIT